MRAAMSCSLAHFLSALRALLFLRIPQEVPGTGFGVIAALVASNIATAAGFQRLQSGKWATFEASGLNYEIAAWGIFAILVLLLRRESRAFALASLIATCAALGTLSALLMMAVSTLPALPLSVLPMLAENFDPEMIPGLAMAVAPWLLCIVWMLIAFWRVGRAASRDLPHRLGFSLPLVALLPCLLFAASGRST